MAKARAGSNSECSENRQGIDPTEKVNRFSPKKVKLKESRQKDDDQAKHPDIGISKKTNNIKAGNP